MLEHLEPRLVLASAWQNPFIERDMSGDAVVSPLDGLLGINELIEPQIIEALGRLPDRSLFPEAPFFDVNGDDFLSPIDILRILNALEQDSEGPAITAQLARDTGRGGQTNADGITSDGRITGELDDLTGITSFLAQVNAGPLFEVSISSLGTFEIDPGPLNDGPQVVRLFARDGKQFSSNLQIPFVLDTVGPAIDTLELVEAFDTAPVGDGQTTDAFVALTGTAAPGETIQLLPAGLSTRTDVAGMFTFPGIPLKLGPNPLSVSATDIAGNQTTRAQTVTRLAPADSIVLQEGNQLAVQASRLIGLGVTAGSRTLSFDVIHGFDLQDQTAAVEDTLLVYLVDANDASHTLLDRGTPGTSLFSLSGDQAEFPPGLVTFDGQSVKIDVTSLPHLAEGRLLFQLLNLDGDTGSQVAISNVQSALDANGAATAAFPLRSNLVNAGGPLDASTLAPAVGVDLQLQNSRFDSATGRYTAELRLHNGPTAFGRTAAVALRGLPAGVTLVHASGTDAGGDPYLNLTPAVRSGGLGANAASQAVLLELNNPTQQQFALVAEVLIGGPNTPPHFGPMDPLAVMPGDTLIVPLAASDDDGDHVTFALDTSVPLPNLTVFQSRLELRPRPDQLGQYELRLTASDGTAATKQTVILNVIADPVTTTRISGIVLDTNQQPLDGLPVEIAGFSAVTATDGSFTIALPTLEVPTESFPIPVPLGDPHLDPFFTGTQQIPLRRARYDVTTGDSSLDPRQHPNLVTSFIDASMVYGSDDARALALRTLVDGKLKTSGVAGDLLPLNDAATFPDGTLENDNAGRQDPATLFAAGDVRANENVALIALHTLLAREHNRLADGIKTADPSLTDEQVYQQARRMVGAIIQHITYSEYLPLLAGADVLPDYSGYDPTVDPSISALFSTAAFRLGHTQLFPEILRLDENGASLPGGPLTLRSAFFTTVPIQNDGIEPYLRGLVAAQAQEADVHVIDDVRNMLFGPPGAGGMDLPAINIQRGRDLGLPSYNRARVDFGLPRVHRFAEITTDPAVQAALQSAYGSVDLVDAWTGGIAEDHLPGAMVGPLFAAIVVDQFTRSRDGDRFWYENGQFTPAELQQIRATTLAELIERNTTITGLPASVFTTGSVPAPPAPAGTAGAGPSSESRSVDGSSNNPLNDALGSTGTNLLENFTRQYGDGISTPGGADRPHARMISNLVHSQDGDFPNAAGATGMFVFWGQFLDHDLDLTPGGVDDTLKILGHQRPNPGGEEAYPFVAEKMPLMLGHDVYPGVNNVIERPIYLPKLDVAHGTTIDPNADLTVVQQIAPGEMAQLFVAAGTLQSRDGTMFNGILSITEVPPDFTPAALPKDTLPDTVVTIQPADMVFTAPAPLTLPNRGGWPTGTEADLWSINPQTGQFEIVGAGFVEGESIVTTEGGLRTSSWHFWIPRGPDIDDGTGDKNNGGGGGGLPQGCFRPIIAEETEDNHTARIAQPGDLSSELPFASSSPREGEEEPPRPCAEPEVLLGPGKLLLPLPLTVYRSKGAIRGVSLEYDSLRAAPAPVLGFQVSNATFAAIEDGIIASASLSRGGVEIAAGGDPSGRNYWKIPAATDTFSAGLAIDMAQQPSGIYDYEMLVTSGQIIPGLPGTQRSSTVLSGRIGVVSSVSSVFGAGWGLAGLQELVTNPDGSLMIVDGDGSQVVLGAAVPNDAGREVYQPPRGDFSVTERMSDGAVIRTMTDQTKYRFTTAGKLGSVATRTGEMTRFEYDAQGRVSGIIDPAGLKTMFTYAGAYVSEITDPAGRVVKLQHGASGDLVKVIYADETEATFAYDRHHRLVSATNAEGQQYRFEYDDIGRLINIVEPDQSSRLIASAESLKAAVGGTSSRATAPEATRLPAGRALVASSSGSTTQYQLNAAGQAVRVVNGGGLAEQQVRNPSNQVVQEINGRGLTTSYTYDSRGNVTSIRDEISGALLQSVGIYDEQLSGGQGTSWRVAAADVDNDGRLDVVSSVSEIFAGGVLLVQRGRGDGRMFDPAVYPMTFTPQSLQLVDLNGDDLLDIVAAQGTTNRPRFGLLSVLLNEGSGIFGGRVDYPMAAGESQIAVGDLNDDQIPDVLYVSVGPSQDGGPEIGNVSVLLGDGTGGFGAPIVVPQVQAPLKVELGDFNEDDVLDALVQYGASTVQGVFRSANVSLLLGQGGGTFAAAQVVIENLRIPVDELARPYDLVVGDFDGDEHLDFAVASAEVGDQVLVLMGNGTGSFSDPAVLAANAGAIALKSFDVDNDNDLDFVLTYANRWMTFANEAGIYVLRYEEPLVPGTTRFDVGDFTGDGFEDLVLIATGTLSPDQAILANDGTGFFGTRATTDPLLTDEVRQPLAGDFNADGSIDVVTLTRTGDPGDYQLLTLIGDGQGGFSQQVATSIPTPPSVVLEAIDALNDGSRDLVGLSASAFVYYENAGGGAFEERQVISFDSDGEGELTVEFRAFDVGDFDGDGVQDVALALDELLLSDRQRSYVAILRNNQGVFENVRQVELADTAFSVNIGRFDADELPDLLIGSIRRQDLLSTSVLRLYRGLGNTQVDGGRDVLVVSERTGGEGEGGTFDNPFSEYVDVWDANGDGRNDLIHRAFFSAPTTYLGQGDGTFTLLQQVAGLEFLTFRERQMVLADVDDDGAQDVLLQEDYRYIVLSNDGQGLLAPTFFLGRDMTGLTTGDVNRDGLTDIIMAGTDQRIHTRLNQLPAREISRRPARFQHDEKFSQPTVYIDELARATVYSIDTITGNRREKRVVIGGLGGDDDLVTTYTYTPEGLLATMTDPLGRVTRYDYDAGCRLIRVTFAVGTPDEASMEFDYDAAGNLTQVSDELGHVTRYEYDPRGRVLRIVQPDPDGAGPQSPPVTSFTYDKVGNLVAMTDSLGFVTQYQFDAKNRLIRETNALGQVESYVYDADGNMLRQIDGLGRSSTYTYDVRDRVVAATDPAGGVTHFTYDADDHVTSITDPLGRTQRMEMDARGRVTRWTDPAGNVQQMVYNAADQAVRMIDRNGHVTAFAYDEAGRMVAATDHLGEVTRYTYDKVENEVSMTDRLGRVTTYSYDHRDRQTGFVDAAGNAGGYTYDAVGNMTEARDTLGRVTRYDYDGLDRLVRRTNPQGVSVELVYDSEDNVLSSSDELGRGTHYTYDALHRVSTVVDALGETQRLAYDAAGNLVQQTDQLGRATRFSYDALDRVVRRTDPLGGAWRSGYDAVGNLTSLEDPLGRVTTLRYDALDRIVRLIDPLSGVTQYTYDPVGNLTSMTDAAGQATTTRYDALNRLVDMTDPLGGVVSFTYDAEGNRQSVTDALGRMTTYQFDALDRITRVTDPLGGAMRYQYDVVGNIVAVTDKLGHATSYVYNNLSQLVRMTDPLGGFQTWTYDPTGRVQSTADPNGNTTTFQYDALQRLTRHTDALGGVTTMQYDAVGNVTAMTDKLGRMTTYAYDALDRLVTLTNPLGGVMTHTYDALGNRLSLTDELGRVQSLQYDALDRLIRHVDPLGNATQYAYDAVDRLTSTTDALGRQTSFQYDALDRHVAVVDALGQISRASYDAVGNVLTTADELGRVSQYSYDALNRRLTETDPLGHTTTFSYDAMGNLLSQADPLGHATRYEYDPLHRTTAIIDPLGARTAYQYDAAGNVLRLTDSLGQANAFTYDRLHRRISETNSLGATRTFQYDAQDNLTRKTDRNGRVTTFTYDMLDRRTAEQWLDVNGAALRTINFSYDAAGQLLSVGDPDAAYAFTYDAAGRTTRVTNTGTPNVPVVQRDYTYDAVHNRLSEAETFGGALQATTAYLFDALDRPTRLTQTGAGTAHKRVDFVYDAAGRLTTLARFADLTGTQQVAASHYSYDPADRLTGLDHRHDGASVASYAWTHDAADRITSAATPDGLSQYTYDARDQLLSANHQTLTNEAYVYDNNGNRTSDGFTVGQDNRLASDGQFTYEYDAEGNRTRRTETATGQVTEYTWDYRNRLTAVVTRNAGGTVVQRTEFTYDPFDNRIAKRVDPDGDGPTAAEAEHYVYSGSQIALVFDEAGDLQQRHLHGPAIDQILADEGALGEVLWPLTDHLGSVRDLADSTGAVVNHRTYDSFGRLVAESNAAVDHLFGYAGRELDEETGLAYHRARYYDPAVGRFVSADPAGFHAGDANLYRYVGNNPLSFVDPSGLVVAGVNNQGQVVNANNSSFSEGGLTASILPRQGSGGEGSSTTAQTGTGRGGDQPGPTSPNQQGEGGSNQNNRPNPTDNSHSQRTQQQEDEKKKKEEEENAKCESSGSGSGGGGGGGAPGPTPSAPPAPQPNPLPGPPSGTSGGGGRSGNALGQMLQQANDALEPAANLLQATEGVSKAFAKGLENKVYDLGKLGVALGGSVVGTGVLLIADDRELAVKIMRESGASDLALAAGTVFNDPGKAVQRMYESVQNDVKAAEQASKTGDYRLTGERIGKIAFNAYDAAGTIKAHVKFHNSLDRGTLKNLMPVNPATRLEQQIIQEFAKEHGLEIGIRSLSPGAKAGRELGTAAHLSNKPVNVKAKSTFGVLVDPKTGKLLTSDLDAAFIRQGNRLLSDHEVTALLRDLNSRMNAAGLQSPFQHGAHLSSSQRFGGPLSSQEYTQIGDPGPVTVFNGRQVTQLSRPQVQQVARQHNVDWQREWGDPFRTFEFDPDAWAGLFFSP